jgi:multidrug efflux pump
MRFTDLFIRRPVLATVISLLILVLGLRSVFTLPVLQYPRTQNALVTITTVYYGANADVVAGFITTPLENAVAQANGIDYMYSNSITSVSTITAVLRLNYDGDKALTEITAKVSSVLNQLPPGAQQPVMTVKVGQSVDAMYMGFSSTVLSQNQITDYLLRAVQPKLQVVNGVQTAEILGAKYFTLRAWLDPAKLAAYGLTATDISQALAANNYISGLGNTKGQMVQVNLTASTDLHTVEEFRNLVIKQSGDAVVHLSDVAEVSLGADDYDTQVGFDGKRAVYIGIQVAPTANLLDVIKGVRDAFPGIKAQLPEGLDGQIIYDSTAFVNSAINEVIRTLIEAIVIVTLVVFVFLGSLRSVAIPVIAIPLSLVGTFTMMLAFGFTINLLTLLALVLAIGLVVDDAIIVVENVNRHLEEGMKPIPAAIKAARELGSPIIAMTIVLIAVYVPIGFQQGLTGALFTEFAFTLVGAVTISAVVALTLSPMMASRMLRRIGPEDRGVQAWLVHFIDRRFNGLRNWYSRRLHGSLSIIPLTVVFVAVIFGAIYFLYQGSKKELAPEEDQGFLIAYNTPAPNATLAQKQLYSKQLYGIASKYPELSHMFQIDSPAVDIGGLVLKPWSERTRVTQRAQYIRNLVLQPDLFKLAGIKSVAVAPPPLPTSFGYPLEFVIGTTEPFSLLNEVATKFTQEALQSGKFFFLDDDLKIDQPQTTVEIDRDKVAQLGLRMSDVGNALSALLGGNYVNYFSLAGRSYKVIPQVSQQFRFNSQQLDNYYIKAADGTTLPLSTVAHLVQSTVPESLNHFQQLNAATLKGVPAPGVSQGEAVAYLQDLAAKTLPQGYSVDYSGPLREFVQESGGFLVTGGFALIIIFLALSAQFESFRDPLIILVSVPMSIFGALMFVNALNIADFIAFQTGAPLYGTSINIYTEVGLVTLMGLVSKHGILIVQFANDLQRQGRTKRQAVEEAAAIRLRPILMTTFAMVLGVVPLITAAGAGAVSRFNMGVVIAAGLSVGTLFTLFVVPAAYVILAADHHKRLTEEEALPAPSEPVPAE